ncbi:hypothetical protein AHAS_Ahas19G0237100 [Arachis hypogaea]
MGSTTTAPIDPLFFSEDHKAMNRAAATFCSHRSNGFDHHSPHHVVVVTELAFSVFVGVASSTVAVARLPPRHR